MNFKINIKDHVRSIGQWAFLSFTVIFLFSCQLHDSGKISGDNPGSLGGDLLDGHQLPFTISEAYFRNVQETLRDLKCPGTPSSKLANGCFFRLNGNSNDLGNLSNLRGRTDLYCITLIDPIRWSEECEGNSSCKAFLSLYSIDDSPCRMKRHKVLSIQLSSGERRSLQVSNRAPRVEQLCDSEHFPTANRSLWPMDWSCGHEGQPEPEIPMENVNAT